MTEHTTFEPISLDSFAAVQARHAAPTVSRAYSFIPTTTALGVLADYGWQPVSAQQARVRVPEMKGYQRHVVRLQNPALNTELKVGTTLPQVYLRNSHGGTSAFVLMIGLFEIICTNGLIADLGGYERARILHRGFSTVQFESALRALVARYGQVMWNVERFRRTIVSPAEELQFARQAIALRWDGEVYTADPAAMVVKGRDEEQAPTLWNLYNVVQERLLKGKIDIMRNDGKERKARAITNFAENERLNLALWKLAATLAD